MVGQMHAADRDRGGNRAVLRRNGGLVHRRQDPFGNLLKRRGFAAGQDNAELVAGVAAEDVAERQFAPNAVDVSSKIRIGRVLSSC